MLEEIIKKNLSRIENDLTEIEGLQNIDFIDIFPRSEEHKKQLDDEVSKISKLVKKTNRGNIYLLNQALKTKYGELRYLKIRYFDETRLNWEAAADFVVKDRDILMNKVGKDKRYSYIKRAEWDAVEFKTENTLIYFLNPLASKVYGKQNMKDIIIITGGANGLGLELVKQALDKGLFVCNIDRDKEKMKQLNADFKENYKGFCGDISDENFIIKVVNEIKDLGNIKILINNAGEPSFKLPMDYEKDDMDKCFKGLYGMIITTTQVLKAKQEKDVKIVNIMSSAALRGNKQESVYCATKWGERGYTESLKVAYKGTNVKIIGVYQGGINTDFYKNSRDYVSEKKQSSFMNPTEVAETIIENVCDKKNLTVADIRIERN